MTFSSASYSNYFHYSTEQGNSRVTDEKQPDELLAFGLE